MNRKTVCLLISMAKVRRFLLMTKGETLIRWYDFPKMRVGFYPICGGMSSLLACLKVYLLDFHEFS